MLIHAYHRPRVPTGFCCAGSSAVASGEAVRPRRVAGRSGPGVGRDDRGHQPLASGLADRGTDGAPGRRASWPQATARAQAVGDDRARPAGGARGPRVQHRGLDAAPRGDADRTPDGRGPSSGPCLAAPAGDGLVAAASRPAGPGTRRSGDCAVEDAALGAAKKTPAGAARGSSSRTKAASPSSPWSAGCGPRGAKRRS
jgi:hypothetical protein